MNKILPYIFMHLGFLLYSFYTVLGKVASSYEFLSLKFCAFYCALILILFVYAFLWQQVLKKIPLSVATANKAITIIWGMIWSFLFFGENITAKKLVGAAIIILGITLLSLEEKINFKLKSMRQNKNEQ